MRAVALAACLLTTACAQIGFQQRPVRANHREVRLSSGVVYEELSLGQGVAATRGDRVELDYTLWLAGGTRVDSTLDRGVPIWITIGEAQVRGLDQGLVGMQAGGRRKIRVPAELGYGKEGVEDMIPPDAELVFEVHLLTIGG